MRTTSETTLVGISERLYEHAKAIDDEALVTNHLWPPFRPNPTYGHRLKHDYCSQTISWYYRPTWSLERVAFEAAEHTCLETPSRNRFVSFIVMCNDPASLWSANRLQQELEIALAYGQRNVVFSTMEPLATPRSLRETVRDVLGES